MYMWQMYGEKDCVLTWGGLMDMVIKDITFLTMVEIRFIMRSQQKS